MTPARPPEHGRIPALRPALIVREVGGETMVYDTRRHRAHCLEPVAAEVWRQWDARSTPQAMARRASLALGFDVDAEAVRIALRRLERAELIEPWAAEPDSAGSGTRPSSRRSALVRVGLGGLAVLSVAVSTPAQTAATCLPPGRECTRSSDCCGKCCNSAAHRCTGGGPSCTNP